MIRAYPGRASVLPGERLVLHAATDSRRFRVHFYRWRDGFEALHSSSWLAGERARERGAGDDWGWPAYEFPVPAHWSSNVVIANPCDFAGEIGRRAAGGKRAPPAYSGGHADALRQPRQVAAMAQKLAERIKQEGFGNARVEGLPAADWVLIDAGDVVVHLFRPEVRSFYNLERMWAFGDAPPVAAGTA